MEKLHTFLEFNAPHQSNSEGEKKLLADILVYPGKAEEGDVVAIGVPVRTYISGTDVVTEFDDELPMPEILVFLNNHLSLGEDDDLRRPVMAKILRWIHLCRKDPENLQGGFELASKICGSLSDKGIGCKTILWYFVDAIAADIWNPAQRHYGLGRSLIDGNKLPRDDFLAISAYWRRKADVDVDYIFTQRNQ